MPVTARQTDAIFTSNSLIAGLGDVIQWPLAAMIENMATGPLLVCFPKPIGRGMSFRIYRLAEKRHKVRGRKRAFAQTITTPGGRDWRGWPGRNGAGRATGTQRCCAPT